jgi:hypothetical protein
MPLRAPGVFRLQLIIGLIEIVLVYVVRRASMIIRGFRRSPFEDFELVQVGIQYWWTTHAQYMRVLRCLVVVACQVMSVTRGGDF